MRGLRGILAGTLALVALHTAVAYRGPGQRLKELVGNKGILTGFVDRFLDPSVPAIADRSKGGWPLDFTPAASPGPVGRSTTPTSPPGGVPGRQTT